MASTQGLSKKTGLAVLGISLLLTGITLVFLWWPQVVAFAQGVLGMTLAVAGLVVLVMVSRD